MLKDTKSLGNNKAPACESRGFVLKKEGVLFDTPSNENRKRFSGELKIVLVGFILVEKIFETR